MNIFRIFLESSLAAQIIMFVLVIFSIWSWAIFLRKVFQFARIRQLCGHFLSNYRFHHHVRELENMGTLLNDNPYGRILKSGLEEYRKLAKSSPALSAQNQPPHSGQWMDELSDNMHLAMERTRMAEIAEIESSLPVLSTIVSVSPFLGLLGTVWGIMEAFLDIRTRGSAHITIVAPGISDALITTVYGLLVAIPALIFFNIFRSRVNKFDAELDRFIKEIYAILRKKLLSGEN